MTRLPEPIELDNLPVRNSGKLPGGGTPNHIEITGFLEDALPVIRERLGGAPKSLHETGDEPITFDTHTKGKQSGWAYVSRKSDGWLLTCGDRRGGVRYTIFVRDALAAGVAPDILLPASRQKDDGAAERAAQKANALCELACLAGDDHPYLVRKGVKPTDTLCELHVGRIREIIGYHPYAGGEPLEGRILIAPVVIGDKISTVELIDEQGRKSALKDGRKSGGYWATGALPETGRLILAEGVATALSIAEALGEPVVAALSVGNLEKVGRALQRPGRELVIAADLGEGGKPHSDAIEAARKLGARLCAPPSGMGKGADFNDLHVRDGLDAVRAAFERPIPAVELAGQDAGGTPLSVCLADEHPLPPEQPFPVEALPELIREAVQEVQDYTQAPTALVAASALTAVSIAVQGLADVEINWMMRRPISLFLLTIAESGERKTTCDRYFTKPLREFEREAAKKAALELVDYSARIAAWEARREGLLKAIQKAGRDGIGLGSSPDEQALIKLQHQMPEKPPVPQLLYLDATTEALAYSLTHSWPSAGLVSSEAGAVFGGYSMGTDTVVRNLALLNQLWDGADFSVDRRTKESFHVRNVRLTIGLQVQPAVMHKFMDGHGAVSRGQGFLARCLLSYPKSTQGTRIAKDPPSRTPGLDAFCQRLRDLLEMPLPRNKEKELEPPALYLAPKARECWKDYANRTERRLLGDLQGLRDVGSKAAENVARLAAVMHMFEQGDTTRDIGEEYITRAAHIVDWYLLEARRFFEESTGAIDLSDAARLKRWLLGYCTIHKTDHVTCRNARNYGPVKDAKRFFAAVNQLAENGDAWLQMEGQRHLLRINPTLLHDFHPSAPSTSTPTPAMSNGGETAGAEGVDVEWGENEKTQPAYANGAEPPAQPPAYPSDSDRHLSGGSSRRVQGVSGSDDAAGSPSSEPHRPTPASDADRDADGEARREALARNRNAGKTVCLMCGETIDMCKCRKPQGNGEGAADSTVPGAEPSQQPANPSDSNGHSSKAADVQPGAGELCEACRTPMTLDDAPDGPTCTSMTQDAPCGITGQSTQPGEADARQSGALEPTPKGNDAPDDATCTGGITRQSTQPGKAASQPDAAERLQAQIDGCLAMETDPALRLFLEQLRRDIHKYPVESVRQELEAYLQAGSPGDFLTRLAALHMSWALDDVAADPDGKRLVRGDTGGRKAILERIEAAFRAETEPVARCYLAKLARKAVSNPPGAGEGLEGYIDARTSPTWLWLAAVFVAGSPEAAFQWRLQEARRKTADARLLGYLDKLEQEARANLPEAVSKLEAFIEILALPDNPTHTIPAQNAPETITDGAQPCAVA